MALPIKFTPDPGGAPMLHMAVDMADVLKETAESFARQVDDELRKMFEFLRRQAVRAKPEDDPKFDQNAQNNALYWLHLILSGYPPELPPKPAPPPGTPAWLVFIAKHGGKDPGCSRQGESQSYTCIESDAVHNALAACERCILKAGYPSVEARNKAVGP